MEDFRSEPHCSGVVGWWEGGRVTGGPPCMRVSSSATADSSTRPQPQSSGRTECLQDHVGTAHKHAPAGATSGYCSGTEITSSNSPPAYGLSGGPCSREGRSSRLDAAHAHLHKTATTAQPLQPAKLAHQPVPGAAPARIAGWSHLAAAGCRRPGCVPPPSAPAADKRG